MKLNWGTGIAIFYSLFVVVLLSFVIKSRSYDHSLVTPDYYAQDLKYQEHYDKMTNTLNLETPLQIKQQQDALRIQFPKSQKAITGEVWLFRPANIREDFRLPIQVGADNQMSIPLSSLGSGRWKVKVDWISDSKAFFQESVVIL